jgi:hypothetical protein
MKKMSTFDSTIMMVVMSISGAEKTMRRRCIRSPSTRSSAGVRVAM